jgi:beta-galactosidase/beta-glucuronidase
VPTEPVHPRPQLTRDAWTELDGPWGYASDSDDLGLQQQWQADSARFSSTITVPFPPESPASGIDAGGATTHWYRREVTLLPPQDGSRRLLHFEGVDYTATVWLDGRLVGCHEGGQVGFTLDVTNAWRDGSTQVVVVRAQDEPDLEQPRGKQDWLTEPHVIWYRPTSGIWRSVWIEDVPAVSVSSVRWSTPDARGTVDFDVRVGGADPGAEIEVEIAHDGHPIGRARVPVTDARATGRIVVSQNHAEPELLQWSPEMPTLLDAAVTLRVDGTVVDRVGSYVGLRTVGVDCRDFLLNERPYFLRLVLEQAYWPDTHLASPSDDDLRREVELVKALGFNGVRMHQVAADPRMLYWCDRLGVLVWADAAAAYRFSPVALARSVREWIEIVERDHNHPSIVAWVPFNESWGIPEVASVDAQASAVHALHSLLKALDPSRVVLGNDGWEYVAGDVVGVHDYAHDPQVLADRFGTADAVRATVATGRTGGRRISLVGAPAAPVVLSEFGGISLAVADDTWDGYGGVADASELVDRLRLLTEQVGPRSGLAGFCYTQLTDTAQERNGLLDEHRRPKAELDALRRAVGGGVSA